MQAEAWFSWAGAPSRALVTKLLRSAWRGVGVTSQKPCDRSKQSSCLFLKKGVGMAAQRQDCKKRNTRFPKSLRLWRFSVCNEFPFKCHVSSACCQQVGRMNSLHFPRRLFSSSPCPFSLSIQPPSKEVFYFMRKISCLSGSFG